MPEPEMKLVPDEEEEEQEPSEPAEDKTKENKKPDASKPDRSEIVQKKLWRGRAEKAEKDVEELRAELGELKKLVAKPTSEQEERAQNYIREQARRVYEELKQAEVKKEEATAKEIETKVAEVLEENPDISEEELLEVMEEEEVEPEIALKFLRRQTPKKEKPKMPQAKRGTAEPAAAKPDDKGKSFFDIAREEISKFKS